MCQRFAMPRRQEAAEKLDILVIIANRSPNSLAAMCSRMKLAARVLWFYKDKKKGPAGCAMRTGKVRPWKFVCGGLKYCIQSHRKHQVDMSE